MPLALTFIAYCNIILTSVTVSLIPPFDIEAISGTLFDPGNSMSINSSICSIEMKKPGPKVPGLKVAN